MEHSTVLNDRIVRMVRNHVGNLEGEYRDGAVELSAYWMGDGMHTRVTLVAGKDGGSERLLVYFNGAWVEGDEWRGLVEQALVKCEEKAKEKKQAEEEYRASCTESERCAKQEKAERFRAMFLDLEVSA